MKTVCVLTATRAEYGLLKRVILALNHDEKIQVKVAVTGMHLSPEYGLTYQEIEDDGIIIDRKIEILLSSNSGESICKSMGLAMIGFGEYFAVLKPDMLVVLGDRYETLSVCIAAMNMQIPIAHIHGGETTEGAIDEVIRHAITKLSYLHFTSTEMYRRRVIQLGEAPNRVFNVGALGIENILQEELLTNEELEGALQFALGNSYAVVTFHPVTLEKATSKMQTQELLTALDCFPNMKFIFTKANADADGKVINELLQRYVEKHLHNCILVSSLGNKRYLSALQNCDMVIGNSSSGIIEAPAFKIPTVNIGDRQKGRVQTNSIINCQPVKEDIIRAIEKAKIMKAKDNLCNPINIYGNGTTSEQIATEIKKALEGNSLNLKKEFYDLEISTL